MVLPALWTATTAATPPPADRSQLGRAFAAIDTDPDDHGPSSRMQSTSVDHDEPGPRHDPDGEPALTRFLTRSLLAHRARPTDREHWLDVASTVTENRVQAVVTGKHRRSYSAAAGLVVAHAEALAAVHGTSSGQQFVTRIRDSYPRHVAFHRELDTALRSSPLTRGPR